MQTSLLDSLANKVGASAVQQKSWELLSEIGLPQKKSESYKYTPITAILQKNINWELEHDFSVEHEFFYKEEGSHLVFSNGVFQKESSKIKSDLSIQFGEVSEGKHDPFSLLNQSLAPGELVITAGTKFPVFVYHFNSAGIANPRIKVKVEDGASIRLYEKLISSRQVNTFTNSYVEYEVGRNAFAYHTKVQNYHENVYSHETVVADVQSDSHFYNNTYSFDAALIRNNLVINLDGENCEGHMYGVFILDKNVHVDNNTSVDHLKPHSYSNELYKGILDEKSTGVFNGKIYVRQDAQKTNAFQSNNNILLSDEATIHTKPQLEIWADDVKCSHGCTSGQLDEDAIFYLRARGINEKSAKAMILNAFAVETMQHIGAKTVEEEVKSYIQQKLS
ncbi:MAG: Fe-S cluster assembly protein SufD [Bacteroidota bacterium]